MKIGFIGLGIMGSRFAANLQKAGYDLIVYDLEDSKMEPFVQNGAQKTDSPASMAEDADVIWTMLPTPYDVDQAANGEKGFLLPMKKEGIWINSGTVDPVFTMQIAEKTHSLGVHFVDAPVAGSKGPAEKGELLVLVGTEDEMLGKISPLLEVIGKKWIHLGPPGKASAMKMVINLLLGQAMLAFSEGMVLGQSMGLSKKELFDVLLNAPVTAPFLSGKKEMIDEDEFEAEFPLKWMHKDFQLITSTAYKNNVSLPSANNAKEIFGMARKHGLGEKDFSAIYHFLHSDLNFSE
jgi:3-hydroxyisobutyrate dehydrogenase/glyoxylate/succinic semialdehyde reductase